MLQHYLTPKLHKKQVHLRGCMSFVTYCNIWLKCYITFCNIVADGKRGFNVLANAIVDFEYLILENIKKAKSLVYSFFTVTVISSLCVLTSHDNLFVFVSSNMPTISEGIVVLNDLDFGFCWITLDCTSNNFIPPFLSFVINIFVNILYIIYL